MENMRHLLSYYDPSEPHYLGLRFHSADLGITYVTGGPGYILSRETVRRIASVLLHSNNDSALLPCNNGYDGHDEDVRLGMPIKFH